MSRDIPDAPLTYSHAMPPEVREAFDQVRVACSSWPKVSMDTLPGGSRLPVEGSLCEVILNPDGAFYSTFAFGVMAAFAGAAIVYALCHMAVGLWGIGRMMMDVRRQMAKSQGAQR